MSEELRKEIVRVLGQEPKSLKVESTLDDYIETCTYQEKVNKYLCFKLDNARSELTTLRADLQRVTAERDRMREAILAHKKAQDRINEEDGTENYYKEDDDLYAAVKPETCHWKQVDSGIGKEAPWTKYKIGCTTNQYISLEECYKYCHHCGKPIEQKEV
jgi:outer membrane murein-binding lipoprotein Lpp